MMHKRHRKVRRLIGIIVSLGISLSLLRCIHHWRMEKFNQTGLTEHQLSTDKSVELKRVSQSNGGVVARRFPYLNDPICRNFSLRTPQSRQDWIGFFLILYEDETFNITGLISYPGSGNTWTRHLIQLASGVFTGSFYFDIDLLAGGFLGEKEAWYSGSTIVQKFHEKYKSSFSMDKAILLVREPIPAIYSFVNYLEAGHTGVAYRTPYNHRDWPSFILHSSYNWLSLAKTWVESPTNLLVIHYEELRLKPVENIRKVCDFISHECPNLNTECFQRKLEGSFRRRPTPNLRNIQEEKRTRPNLPPEVQEIVSRGIDYLNNMLVNYGHDPLPIRFYQFYSSPKI